MTTKIKCSLYFVCFFIAVMTYYNVAQTATQQVAIKKEITKIENVTVATQNVTDMNNLQ